jgi:hypothetical protein
VGEERKDSEGSTCEGRVGRIVKERKGRKEGRKTGRKYIHTDTYIYVYNNLHSSHK